MKRLFLVTMLGHAGCEGCDFSFGPIPLVVRVTPEDAEATVIVCDEEDEAVYCTTLGAPVDTGLGVDTALAVDTGESVPGTLSSSVGWDGYISCRYPELEIDVTAPGCEPVHVSVPRQRPPEGAITVDVALDCG